MNYYLIFVEIYKTTPMKAFFETIKTLFATFDKPKKVVTEIEESKLLEKWWLNDEILRSIQVNDR